MGFGGISFGGLASGLDTGAIIDQLIAVERIPITLLERQKAVEQTRLDLVGTFKGLVEALRDKADGLRKQSGFLDFNVSASAESVANFSASGLAVPGSHTLEVQSLAAADIWAFDGVNDPDSDLASAEGQQISFDVNGTNYSITLTQDQSSLNEIAAEINQLAGDDVTARVVNTGSASAPYQLVLSSDETGEDFRISGVVSTVAGLTIDGTPPDMAGNPVSTNNLVAGSNAIAVIDGLTVARSSNEFSDVIAGVTIDLLSTTDAQGISFTVEADTTKVKEKVQEFVDAYNEVIDFINEQNTYNEEEGPGGELFGDGLLRTVRRQIGDALFNVPLATVQADLEGYSTLGLVGIERESDGKLSIDDTRFEEKLLGNLDAFMDLFVDTDGFDNGGAAENTPEYFQDTTVDSGLADNLFRTIDQMFKTFTADSGDALKGIFANKTDLLTRSLRRFDDQIDQKELQLERFEENLVLRFSRLEEVMGALNSQGAALNNLIATLSFN